MLAKQKVAKNFSIIYSEAEAEAEDLVEERPCIEDGKASQERSKLEGII